MSGSLLALLGAGSGGGSPPASYVGPGDIIAGASPWYGLRAYSAATAGTAAIRLRRDSDDTEQDFNTLATGALDVASIAAFKGAANLFVRTLYDQSGSAFAIGQPTSANQPSFLLATLGALPVIATSSAGSIQYLITPGSVSSVSQPNTVSCVYNRLSASGAYQGIFNNENTCFFLGDAAADNVTIYTAGSLPSASAVDGSFHAVQGIYNGATSVIDVDGVSTAADLGNTTGWDGSALNIANFANRKIDMYFCEAGLWPSRFSAGTLAAMNTNQHAYWGF